MKPVIEVFLAGLLFTSVAGAQNEPKRVLRQGVSVQMAVAGHAVEMRAADEENAIVVAITADGRVYAGIQPTEPAALSNLSEGTVYVKADSRVQYQQVLAVLDALHGRRVVLLTAPPKNAERETFVSPYGIQLTVAR